LDQVSAMRAFALPFQLMLQSGTSLGSTPAAIGLDKFQKRCRDGVPGIEFPNEGQDKRSLNVSFSNPPGSVEFTQKLLSGRDREHTPWFDISRHLAVDANVTPKQFLR
jgi:hypothetical protein